MMILEIKNVVAGYLPDVNVLQGINIHVSQGELVCMIGPNGAGKSTVLRAISGILKPSQGEILFGGKNIGGLRPDLVLRQGIAHVPQGRGTFAELSVHENLQTGAIFRKDRAAATKEIDHWFERFPVLGKRRSQPAGLLSGG
ncbi:MAG: ATP-binding cassette domain-containing protein, partial [Anaerolineales bacterium]|nr:ATP-binding cassette domain-containing protein [Anaerolineales bacterium]